MSGNFSEAGIVGGIGSAFVVLGKIILLVCYLIYWKSRLLTSKKDALIMDTTVRFIAVIAFLLQFSFTGVVYNVFCIIRNFRAERIRGWPKDLKRRDFLILLAIFLMAFFALNLPKTNHLELLLIIGIYGAVNLYGTAAATGMRGILLFNITAIPFSCYVCWRMKSGLWCEIISLVVCIIGYIKNKNNETDL